MLEVKFEYNINGVREAIADSENVHMLLVKRL